MKQTRIHPETLSRSNEGHETVQVACLRCELPFGARAFRLHGRLLHVNRCPACTEEAELEARAAALAERADAWSRVCPAAYQECDPALLPGDESRAALTKALAWDAADGFGLIGRMSGRGQKPDHPLRGTPSVPGRTNAANSQLRGLCPGD